jgi:uncharacterized membrane protein
MDKPVTFYLIVFVLVPFLIALATYIACGHKRNYCDWIFDILERKGWKLFITITLCYFFLFELLSILRYLSLHTTLLDLGLYDNKVWRIAHYGQLSASIDGHLRPIIILFAPLYLIVSSPMILLTIQTFMLTLGGVLLFNYSQLILNSRAASLIILLAYFLYPSLEFNNLFDFHTDHMIIPIFFAAFCFIEQGKKKLFLLSLLPGLFLKEPLLLSIVGMGIYVIVIKRWWREGCAVIAASLLLLYIQWNYLAPAFWDETHLVTTAAFPNPFSHLEVPLHLIILKPWIIARELFYTDPAKMGYVMVLFVPLLFLPLFSLTPLITAIPHLIISIISHNPSHYSMAGQYTASVIPGFFVAMIFTIKKIHHYRATMVKPVLMSLLLLGLYYNIVQSPSPLSLKFWVYENWYDKSSYRISKRDREIIRFIKTHVPSDPEVALCTQNTLNHAWLAHRKRYFSFPYLVDKVDYVVLDLKRPLFLGEATASPESFSQEIRKLERDFEKLVEWDGFYIWKRKDGIGD